jgi:hypothetical protein
LTNWPQDIPPDLKDALTPLTKDVEGVIETICAWAAQHGIELPENLSKIVERHLGFRNIEPQSLWGDVRECLTGEPPDTLPIRKPREDRVRF